MVHPLYVTSLTICGPYIQRILKVTIATRTHYTLYSLMPMYVIMGSDWEGPYLNFHEDLVGPHVRPGKDCADGLQRMLCLVRERLWACECDLLKKCITSLLGSGFCVSVLMASFFFLFFFFFGGWINGIVFQTYGVLLVASHSQVKTLNSLWYKKLNLHLLFVDKKFYQLSIMT